MIRAPARAVARTIEPLPPRVPTSGVLERVEPDEPPFARGKPPPIFWAAEGTPPFGLQNVGALMTAGGWLIACSKCLKGWCALMPDGQPYSYRLAFELGCSRGCDPNSIAWWSAWRSMELPAEDPDPRPPTRRARAYALGVARAEVVALGGPAARRDPAAALRRAAYRIGRVLASGGLPEGLVAEALLLAGRALGIDATAVRLIAVPALAAGQAAPRELPR